MPSWVSPLAAVLSFLFAVGSWWWSNLSKQARSKADDAKDKAEKARDTAVEQVATLTRLAETLEAQAANRDPWALAPQGDGNQFRLTNISGADATDVSITGPRRVKPSAFDRVDNRSEVSFSALAGAGEQAAVVIAWTPDQPDAEQRTVRLVLPRR